MKKDRTRRQPVLPSWASMLPNVPSSSGYGDVSFSSAETNTVDRPRREPTALDREMTSLIPELIAKPQPK